LETSRDQSAAWNKELHMNLVTLNLAHTKTRPPRRRLISGITSMLARWIGLDSASRAERALNGMPDELLADLGIGRSEIAYYYS